MQRSIQKIHRNTHHPRETFRLHLSIGLERISYHGIKGTLVFYMFDRLEGMNDVQIATIFGWFAFGIAVSKILGGLLGDLIFGNKKALIIGGILEALGAFILCFESVNSLYIGLFLITIGSGMFYTNLTAEFGKHYRVNPKLLDAGFSILYITTNITAAIGGIIVSSIALDFKGIFIFLGLLIGLSTLIYATSHSNKELAVVASNTTSSSITKRHLIIVFLLIPLFWGIYEFMYPSLNELSLNFLGGKNQSSEMTSIPFVKSIFSISLLIISSVVWSYFYIAQSKKLVIAFTFTTFSVVAFLFGHENLTATTLVLYSSFFLFNISEVLVYPLIHSLLTKFSPTKYLATFMGITVIPTMIITFFNTAFLNNFSLSTTMTLKIAAASFGLISILMLIYFKKKTGFSSSINK